VGKMNPFLKVVVIGRSENENVYKSEEKNILNIGIYGLNKKIFNLLPPLVIYEEVGAG
jgi:hypothetical protein